MKNMIRHKSIFNIFFAAVLISGIFVASFMFLGYKKALSLWGIRDLKTDSYSAIFLDNNQVYFGLIKNSNLSALSLDDVYYFGSNGAGDPDSEDLSLVKLGAELHGPEDKMKIFFEHIIFIETLGDDSRVVAAILEHKDKK